jgi:hypothetical protein
LDALWRIAWTQLAVFDQFLVRTAVREALLARPALEFPGASLGYNRIEAFD